MPELPEVETCKRGIQPYLKNKTIKKILIHYPTLRLPIDKKLINLENHSIIKVSRRAKYLIIKTKIGSILIHLGMSGKLSICQSNLGLKKHDHFEIILDNNISCRLNDPRRFGLVLFTKNPKEHKLLKNLAPEPLTDDFNDEYLQKICRNSKATIKNIIMDNKKVVGVGNIYANEVLFACNIHPLKKAHTLSFGQTKNIVHNIKTILQKAIKKGGTTLKDFANPDGLAGYFFQELNVYGKAGQKCPRCQDVIIKISNSQRATFFCPSCQK
jgi:formamidopyrimidine-DNA glycosylase